MASGVEVLNSPLVWGESLARAGRIVVNVELDALVSDTEELEDALVVGDPRGDGGSVQAEEHIVLVRWNVVEGDSIWLGSSSAHVPDLVAASKIVEVLVVSSGWHGDSRVGVVPWEVDEVGEGLPSEVSGDFSPAIDLVVEEGFEARPVSVKGGFESREAFFNGGS